MSHFQQYRNDSFPPIVKNLIIINIIIWIAQLMFDKENGVLTFALTAKIGLYPVDFPQFKPYQIVTHMFAHASYDYISFAQSRISFFHILFNMFNLYVFGRILENIWGGKRFLLFYLLCGLGAAAAHLIMQSIMGNAAMAIGASGAVMGVMVAFACLFPNTELMLMFIPLPIKAKWVIGGLIAIGIFGGFSNLSGDNIAHFAHLGGALTGFIIVQIWNKTNRKTLF